MILSLLQLRGLGVRAVMAALPCLLKERLNQELYLAYSSECLRILTENTARYAGGDKMTAKYIDMINSKPKDARSGEEIAADVIKKAGLKAVIKN